VHIFVINNQQSLVGGFIKDSVLEPRLTRGAQKLLYNFHVRLKKTTLTRNQEIYGMNQKKTKT